MQRGPISIENKDSYFTENTLGNKAEQENLIPVGMSKSPESNTGNDCISQDHNILQADTSSNILKQKNGGELISSDSNQNFSCPIVDFIHDASLPIKIENTKPVKTELKDTCIDKEPYVQSLLLNSKKGNFEDTNSCTDAGDSNEIQGEMDVQEDENSASSSCLDSSNATSVPVALKSSSEGDDYGTTMAQDSGQCVPFTKDMGKMVMKVVSKFVKAQKSKKKKIKSLSKEDFHLYTWKLTDYCDIEKYRNIYEVHLSWLKSLKQQQITVTNLREYVLLVKIESCVAVAFNKIKNSLVEGVSFNNLCEAITPHSHGFDLSELEYILSHSPLYCKMNDVWKKCYAVDGIKEENHWQGILYMRKIWANIKPSSEDRFIIVKFFLSNSCDKSADGLARSVCKGLHIPYCFDMVEKVLDILKDLLRRKEVVRVTGGTSSATGGPSPEEATGRPTSFLDVQKSVISSEKCTEGLTQEMSSLQSSSTVAESEKSNVVKCENSDECMPAQSVSDSTVSSVCVGELSQTTVSSLDATQKTCGTTNFSEKSVEQNLDEATTPGEQAIVNAITDVNSYIRVFVNKEGNEITKEPSLKQESPVSEEKQIKKIKIKINCSPKGKRGRKPKESTPDDYFLPMAQGWVRELVRRAVTNSSRYDVYYHPPVGPKLRSVVEIKKFLSAKNITNLSEQNFSFGKNPLGCGPPYELIRDAHVSRNYFKRKVSDTSSPETPMKKLTETPAAESTPMKKVKLSPASCSSDLTPLSGGTKEKGKRKSKVKVPMNATLYPLAPTSTDNIHSTTVNESQASMLNESWDDEVDITNEVGETTGYEGWFTINQTNKSSSHTKTKPAEIVNKILIKTKMAGSCSVNKGQGVEATILSDIPAKRSPPVKPSSSKSSGEVSKGALSTGLNDETRKSTQVQSHGQNEGKIPNIYQDAGQVIKSPWLDIIDKYEKRKIIRERNSGRKLHDIMPVGMKKCSNLVKNPVDTIFHPRQFPEPKPKSTTSEKSACQIRVKCFSELAEVPRNSQTLNCMREVIQSIPVPTPSISSSSVLGGKSLQPASGSGNSLVKRSSGQTNPQQSKPTFSLGYNSRNSCQVLKGSEPDPSAPVWHSPLSPVGTQVLVPQGSSPPVFSVSSPQPMLPFCSVNRTISINNFNTSIAPVTPMMPALSQVPIMQPIVQPLLLHNSPSPLAPIQQGTSHLTQVPSQPTGTDFLTQNTRLNFTQRTCQNQADTAQLSTSTSHQQHNTESIQTNTGSNVGETGFGFYKELSTMNGNG
ncbi:uncharacterized protein LOC135216795 isoform X2 [Macrobrachium nipponense]|uniref:uncharacterized protein LOC135216795 isoform X2 n=1 Tax=Macrobrachium nipponense TaxID=159736 RepID=UPI0030C8B136